MTVEEPLSPSLSSPPGAGGSPQPATPQPEAARPRSSRWLGRVALIVFLVGGCSAAIWYWAIREPEPWDDLGRFQGDWKLTFGGQDRKEGNEKLPPHAIRISGDRWQYYVGGSEGKTYRIVLNETASPKEIELTLLDSSGNPVGAYGSHGIYTIDRTTARIVVEPVNKPRPKDFENPDSVVWVLTRVKLELTTEHRK